MKRLILCIGTLLMISAVAVAAEPNDINSVIEERFTELEERINELEDRIELLEEQQDDEEPEEREVNSSDRAAEIEAKRKEKLEEQVQDIWDDIAAIDAKLTHQPSTDSRIAYLNVRAKLLASKERLLKKIKHIARRNPDVEIDVIMLEKDIIKCRSAKKNCYDQVGDIRRAERESKKYRDIRRAERESKKYQ